MSDHSDQSGHAGAVYLQHIRDQLAEQRDRKKSLEQRGQTSVAISGGLVVLLAAVTNEPVTAAVVLLVLGAVAGVPALRRVFPEVCAKTSTSHPR